MVSPILNLQGCVEPIPSSGLRHYRIYLVRKYRPNSKIAMPTFHLYRLYFPLGLFETLHRYSDIILGNHLPPSLRRGLRKFNKNYFHCHLAKLRQKAVETIIIRVTP